MLACSGTSPKKHPAPSPLPCGERARVRGTSRLDVTFEFGKNDGQDALRILQHIRIPKSQHTIALACKIRVTAPVALTIRVLAAVDLNHKALFFAKKGDNPGPNWNLAAKLVPSEPAVAKVIPELAFGVGQVRPQLAGSMRANLFHIPSPQPSPLRGEGERTSLPDA
jgi:hypothetical protein